jgi:hypothetical protein
MPESKAIQVKVTLQGTKPSIWRRIEVTGDVKLFSFHRIIQVAMGWTDSHMHQFAAKGKFYGVPDPESRVGIENEKKVQLDQVLNKPKDRMTLCIHV